MSVLSIHDLNLIDDAAVIFPHIHFNRLAGLCLLGAVFFIFRIVPGDKVEVELSPYDLTKGRITYRFMPGRAGPPGYP